MRCMSGGSVLLRRAIGCALSEIEKALWARAHGELDEFVGGVVKGERRRNDSCWSGTASQNSTAKNSDPGRYKREARRAPARNARTGCHFAGQATRVQSRIALHRTILYDNGGGNADFAALAIRPRRFERTGFHPPRRFTSRRAPCPTCSCCPQHPRPRRTTASHPARPACILRTLGHIPAMCHMDEPTRP